MSRWVLNLILLHSPERLHRTLWSACHNQLQVFSPWNFLMLLPSRKWLTAAPPKADTQILSTWTSLPVLTARGFHSLRAINVWVNFLKPGTISVPLSVDGIVFKRGIEKGMILGQRATTKNKTEISRGSGGAYLGWTTASEILSHGDWFHPYKTAHETWSLWCSPKVECLFHRSAPSAVGHHRAEIREKTPAWRARSTHAAKAVSWFKS